VRRGPRGQAGTEVLLGRIAQTWELISESFAVLKSDTALMLMPVFSGAFCLLVSIAILGSAGLLFLPPNFYSRMRSGSPCRKGCGSPSFSFISETTSS
jgi:hypothetical protein